MSKMDKLSAEAERIDIKSFTVIPYVKAPQKGQVES
jgi:hypothetical protein